MLSKLQTTGWVLLLLLFEGLTEAVGGRVAEAREVAGG